MTCKKKLIFVLAGVSFLAFSGCDVVKNLANTFAMKDCNYKYNSVSDVVVADIRLSEGISAFSFPKIMALLGNAATTIPASFTLSLDVENPNAREAGFEKLDYILQIDSITFTSGKVNEAFSVPAGGRGVLPLQISMDLATLINRQMGDAALTFAKNLLGMGSEPSHVTLKVKPTVKLGQTLVESPEFLPITFTIGVQ